MSGAHEQQTGPAEPASPAESPALPAPCMKALKDSSCGSGVLVTPTAGGANSSLKMLQSLAGRCDRLEAVRSLEVSLEPNYGK